MKFSPAVGSVGSAPKISDEAIIAIVRERCVPFVHPGTKKLIRVAYKRADLISELIDMGMSRTPALKRIETLVKRGGISMGDNPWPESYNYPTPGIHVWISEPQVEAAPVDDDARFLDAVRSIAPGVESAMSLRMIHSQLGSGLPMSLATVSRRMTPLVQAGLVVKCETGYYAPAASMDVE